jgi:hypothetical protein
MTEKITKALFLVLKGKLEPDFLYSHLNFDHTYTPRDFYDTSKNYHISFDPKTGYTYHDKGHGGPPYFDEWSKAYLLPLSLLIEMAEVNKGIEQLLDDCASLLNTKKLFPKAYTTWEGWEAKNELPPNIQNWKENYLKRQKAEEDRIREEENKKTELQKITESVVLSEPTKESFEKSLYLLKSNLIEKEHLFEQDLCFNKNQPVLYIDGFDFKLGMLVENPAANVVFNERANPDAPYSNIPKWIMKADKLSLEQLFDLHKTRPADDTLRTEVAAQVVFQSKMFDEKEFKDWLKRLHKSAK